MAGSPSLHAGVRAECWSTEYGRQLLAADWLLVVGCEVRVMLKVLSMVKGHGKASGMVRVPEKFLAWLRGKFLWSDTFKTASFHGGA